MVQNSDKPVEEEKRKRKLPEQPSNVLAVDEEGEEEVITLNADNGAAAAGEFSDDDEDQADQEESDEQRKERAEHDRSIRRPKNAQEVLTQFVPNRSERADEKLRAHLIGKIAIKIDGSGDEFLFEMIAGRATVEIGAVDSVDCRIRLSETNLMRVVAGELNPQIAMLSSKIKVEGKAELAIYFFNLLAPRAH